MKNQKSCHHFVILNDYLYVYSSRLFNLLLDVIDSGIYRALKLTARRP